MEEDDMVKSMAIASYGERERDEPMRREGCKPKGAIRRCQKIPCNKRAFIGKNIYSGWEKTSIYPFKLDVILDKFLVKKTPIEDRPLLSKSSKLVLTRGSLRKLLLMFLILVSKN